MHGVNFQWAVSVLMINRYDSFIAKLTKVQGGRFAIQSPMDRQVCQLFLRFRLYLNYSNYLNSVFVCYVYVYINKPYICH